MARRPGPASNSVSKPPGSHQGPTVCRLPAGGNRIRTFGPTRPLVAARDPTHSNRERSGTNKGRGMWSREGGHHQCTVLDQECRQGARSRDASDKEGKPVVFSVCSLVIPGLRAHAVAKPAGMEPESSVARYSAMSSLASFWDK